MALNDALTATGLEVSSYSEIYTYLTQALQGIYGSDINTDSNSPDGQWLGIISQEGIDTRELLLNVNSSFDPDQAVGTILDQRVAINNIQREGGTYTIQPISIVANATVTLQGLDTNFNNPNGTGYTVQDGSGNQFILQTTTTLMAGTTVCDFRAAIIGDVNVPLNTIINPVTIISGVTSVNNPTAATTIGQTQETDGQLRIRRQQSVANATVGYLPGLQGKILALTGVTEATAYSNNSGTTDGTGTPGHYVWLIVAGGSSSDIANVLYNTINGAGMRGSQSTNITTPSGANFVAYWDNPISENLYIKFNLKTTVTGTVFNTTGIAAAMAAALTYGIGASADTSEVTVAAINAIVSYGGGGVPIDVYVSIDGSTWTDFVATTDLQHQFEVSASNIAITVE